MNGLPGISQHLGSTILLPVPLSGRDKPFRPVSSIFIQEPDCRSDACTVFLWPFKPDSYPSSLCLIQIELRIGCVLLNHQIGSAIAVQIPERGSSLFSIDHNA